MTTVTLRGNTFHTVGELPKAGSKAPDFKLVNSELKDVGLRDFAGKRKVLNIFPSVDTPTCALSVKAFNDHARKHPEVLMLQISADLPFAQSRFCGNEGLDNVLTLSMMRDRKFAEDYGTLLTDGPLAGISARAVVVLDEQGQVLHSELVPEIAQEPDYQAALKALG